MRPAKHVRDNCLANLVRRVSGAAHGRPLLSITMSTKLVLPLLLHHHATTETYARLLLPKSASRHSYAMVRRHQQNRQRGAFPLLGNWRIL